MKVESHARSKSPRTKRIIAGGFGALLLIFFGVGYAFSDAVFFKQLVRQHHLETPDDAWQFLGENTTPAHSGQPVISGLSARYMLTQKQGLYCDEGALLMATIIREKGYRSRLVDLHGSDGISHHTVLEVEENGRWQTYDTLLRYRHKTLTESARGCQFTLVKPVRRPSWNWYRTAVYNNALVKFGVFKLRGIPG